jgi:hypothetical protein
MPVIRDIPLRLKTKEVLRRQGFRGHSKIRPEITKLILELLATVESAHLLEPAAAYEIYPIPITETSQLKPSSKRKVVVQGLSLLPLLAKAKELATVVCTIGPKLEEQATEYFSRGEPLRGTLLDGIGSAAVDSLTQEVCKLITGEASSRGYQASSPISPGMPGLPIEEQRQLLKLASAGKVGVSLTTSGMMNPRKSASMVIGIGLQMATWTQAEVCASCSIRKTCPYRIEAPVEQQNKAEAGRE